MYRVPEGDRVVTGGGGTCGPGGTGFTDQGAEVEPRAASRREGRKGVLGRRNSKLKARQLVCWGEGEVREGFTYRNKGLWPFPLVTERVLAGVWSCLSL